MPLLSRGISASPQSILHTLFFLVPFREIIPKSGEETGGAYEVGMHAVRARPVKWRQAEHPALFRTENAPWRDWICSCIKIVSTCQQPNVKIV